MNKETIKVPEKGTYQWQLFDYWSDEFRHTHADHSAYIALNFAGVLDACRNKFHSLIQHHSQHVCDAKAVMNIQQQRTCAEMYDNIKHLHQLV